MVHAEIPRALWDTFCPWRALRRPDVVARITTFIRSTEFRVLPGDGGLDDQEEELLQAFDVLTAARREILDGRHQRDL